VYLATIPFSGVGLFIESFVSDIDHLVTKKVDIRLEKGAIVNTHMDTGAGLEREKCIGCLFTGAYYY
jgi:hypothetical protein